MFKGPSLMYCALWAVGGYRILGQANPSVMEGIGALVGSLGVVAVLVWFLWYNTTHAQPTMVKTFSEEIAKIRAEREAERKAAALETAELRAMFVQYLQGMRSAVHDTRDTAQQAINKIALTKLEQAAKPPEGS